MLTHILQGNSSYMHPQKWTNLSKARIILPCLLILSKTKPIHPTVAEAHSSFRQKSNHGSHVILPHALAFMTPASPSSKCASSAISCPFTPVFYEATYNLQLDLLIYQMSDPKKSQGTQAGLKSYSLYQVIL